MKNKNSLNIFILFTFFILLLIPSNLFSQQTKDVSNIMALKLKQKVILSDEQTEKVKVILSNYIKDLTGDDNNSGSLKKAKDDIETLLNEKQKVKYDIIKDDFFDEVNKKALNKYWSYLYTNPAVQIDWFSYYGRERLSQISYIRFFPALFLPQAAQ